MSIVCMLISAALMGTVYIMTVRNFRSLCPFLEETILILEIQDVQ